MLTNRCQRVKMGDISTVWGQLNEEVPQGTKLGPILFLCMINDISLDLPTFKYVDDTSTVLITDDSGDNRLQVDADSAASWSREMNVQLNAKKTVELVVDFNIIQQYINSGVETPY